MVLLHRGNGDVAAIANRLWYPLWDAGLQLGHGVRTVKEALSLAAGDLDTATSLLDARLVAGDQRLADALAEGADADWRKKGGRRLEEMARRVVERHERHGDLAFLLEPDLKESKGGLRDVHALRWAAAAGAPVAVNGATLAAYDLLLGVRVALHRSTGRAGDQLVLQEQDAVADALGYSDADALMAAVAGAARTIAWASDEGWRAVAVARRGRRRDRPRRLEAGLEVRDGEVSLADDADLADPALVLRAAAAAATAGEPISHAALARLAAVAPGPGNPWPREARDALVTLLAAGHAAIPVIESLDQHGLLVRTLPEWEQVRNRPQRNAYHRFTVDRHLCEAAANAASLTKNVARPDLLLVGALLHDIGKGRPGDHTEVGMELVAAIGARMGFSPSDVETLIAMVRHHLLLPDVATRRDLDDPATITAVADAVGDVDTLRLLDALTEADSLATGPSAWGSWKAGLVRELVARTTRVLQGHTDEPAPAMPTEMHRELMADRTLKVVREGDEIIIVAPDRPGLFARVAGTLSLHGLDILSAAAASEEGMAVEVFRVQPALDVEPDFGRLEEDLRRALRGRLALEARLAERMRTYGTTYASRAVAAPHPPESRVLWHADASQSATVVEVRAPDAIGVLYRITRALAECDLDVRSAKVQTLGQEVIDTFYVCDAEGGKVEDPHHMREIERAVLAALDRS